MSKNFKKWQEEHPNFITPHLVRHAVKGDKVIELSEGWGFSGEKLYGVTVLKMKFDPKKQKITYESVADEKTNKVFDNKMDALKHFNRLRRMM